MVWYLALISGIKMPRINTRIIKEMYLHQKILTTGRELYDIFLLLSCQFYYLVEEIINKIVNFMITITSEIKLIIAFLFVVLTVSLTT